MTTQNNRPRSEWLEKLSRNRVQVAYALFGLALAFAVGALVLGLRTKLEHAFVLFLLLVSALASAGGGVWQMTREAGEAEDRLTRVLVLCVGGGFGLVIASFGLYLIVIWQKVILGGVEQWQGEEGWKFITSLSVYLLGLAVMFFSLLVGRTEERENATIRRFIYAYNAVLSTNLVAALLIVVNILGYLYLPAMSDWTAAELYTLSSKTKNTLEGLDRIVHVKVLQSGRLPPIHEDLRNLLDNFQSVTSKLQVENIQVHRQPRATKELMARYGLSEQEGVLIVYGEGANPPHRFIKETDLFDPSPGPSREDRYTFKGEDALTSALESLSQGVKPVVYFTQGSGEPDLEDPDRSSPENAMTSLREQLERGNYEVKGLQLQKLAVGPKAGRATIADSKVPNDAAAVVIVGPRRALGPEALAALTEYMNRADPKTQAKIGKLLVLLDVVTDRDGTMVQTGLEKWLEEYSVDVGTNRVLTLQGQVPSPSDILVIPNVRQRNPVATAFANAIFVFREVRTVRPRMQAGSSPTQSRFRAEELFFAAQPSWADANLRADPTEYVNNLQEKNQEELQRLLERDRTVPVAVAVSEGGAMPNIPEHQGVPPKDSKPRLVVFGDATLATNAMVRPGNAYFALVSSSLGWLRERPQSIGIPPKKRDVYSMEQNTNLFRLSLLPPILLGGAVIGFGVGVWVVRRK